MTIVLCYMPSLLSAIPFIAKYKNTPHVKHITWNHFYNLDNSFKEHYDRARSKGNLASSSITFLDFTVNCYLPYDKYGETGTKSIFLYHTLCPFTAKFNRPSPLYSGGSSMLIRMVNISKSFSPYIPIIVHFTPFNINYLKKFIEEDPSNGDITIFTVPLLSFFPSNRDLKLRPLKERKKSSLDLDFINSISYIK